MSPALLAAWQRLHREQLEEADDREHAERKMRELVRTYYADARADGYEGSVCIVCQESQRDCIETIAAELGLPVFESGWAPAGTVILWRGAPDDDDVRAVAAADPRTWPGAN